MRRKNELSIHFPYTETHPTIFSTEICVYIYIYIRAILTYAILVNNLTLCNGRWDYSNRRASSRRRGVRVQIHRRPDSQDGDSPDIKSTSDEPQIFFWQPPYIWQPAARSPDKGGHQRCPTSRLHDPGFDAIPMADDRQRSNQNRTPLSFLIRLVLKRPGVGVVPDIVHFRSS